jgi:methionyl-tRNA synthetase
MLEYIQTDIWVRFQKMRGNQALRLRRRRPRHGHHAARRKEGITPSS